MTTKQRARQGATPGPWKIDEAKDLPLAVIRDNENGAGICELELQNAEGKANARLIAQAPALLEALKAVWNGDDAGHDFSLSPRVRQMVEAAILAVERDWEWSMKP